MKLNRSLDISSNKVQQLKSGEVLDMLEEVFRLGVKIVVPCKRERNYEIASTTAHGDEIIEIK